MIFQGEILSWSLMGVKGLNNNPDSSSFYDYSCPITHMLETAQSTTTQGFKLQNKTALWLCDVIQNTIIKKILSTL